VNQLRSIASCSVLAFSSSQTRERNPQKPNPPIEDPRTKEFSSKLGTAHIHSSSNFLRTIIIPCRDFETGLPVSPNSVTQTQKMKNLEFLFTYGTHHFLCIFYDLVGTEVA
jgi:hypothetical protein